MTASTQERAGERGSQYGGSAATEWFALGWRASVVVVSGMLVGLLVNLVRADAVALEPYSPAAMCPGAPLLAAAEPSVLAPADVAPMCAATDAIIIDTRSAIDFANGHAAGAVHLPCTASRGAADTALQLIGARTTAIFYGDSTEEALQVASDLLAKSGRDDINTVVIEGGFEAWQKAKQPCASGPCEHCESEFFHGPDN